MANESDITNSLLMKQILDEMNMIKSKMPNGELKHMQDGMDEMRKNFKEMKDDLSEMKRKLLDPDDGVIVKNKKLLVWSVYWYLIALSVVLVKLDTNGVQ
jgi:hypothetical protein